MTSTTPDAHEPRPEKPPRSPARRLVTDGIVVGSVSQPAVNRWNPQTAYLAIVAHRTMDGQLALSRTAEPFQRIHSRGKRVYVLPPLRGTLVRVETTDAEPSVVRVAADNRGSGSARGWVQPLAPAWLTIGGLVLLFTAGTLGVAVGAAVYFVLRGVLARKRRGAELVAFIDATSGTPRLATDLDREDKQLARELLILVVAMAAVVCAGVAAVLRSGRFGQEFTLDQLVQAWFCALPSLMILVSGYTLLAMPIKVRAARREHARLYGSGRLVTATVEQVVRLGDGTTVGAAVALARYRDGADDVVGCVLLDDPTTHVGATVRLVVDPDDPNRCEVANPSHAPGGYSGLGRLALLLLAGVALFVVVWNWMPAPMGGLR